jgi:hypothetical protein
MDESPDRGVSEWGKTMWGPFVRQAKRPRTFKGTVEERLQRLEDEAAVLDTFRRYHYFYDAGDVDGVLSCFTADGVQVNRRGTYVGTDQLRSSYEYLVRDQRLIIHYGTNAVVRFDQDDPKGTAWLTAFYHSVVAPFDGDLFDCGGVYIDRMRRVGDDWLISEQRITYNFESTKVTRPHIPAADQPAPDGSLRTPDLIEDRYLLA